MPRGSLRVSFRRCLLAAMVVLSEVALPVSVWAADEHKRVLALYATRRDSEFALIGEQELPRTLDVALARNLDYYSEFIDITRFPDPEYKVAFTDFMRSKYQGIQFDLVIALQDVAIEFVTVNRDSLFPDTPVVFLANAKTDRTVGNATGLIVERNFTGTLALLEQLQPDVTQVFVVVGAATADRSFEKAVQAQVRSFSPKLTFTYLSGLKTAELEQRLATLPEHSAVYYVLVSEDGTGDKFHPLEYVDRIAAAANAPTYCWVESAMDHGILGGSLYSQRGAMQNVGRVALRVLRGEAADRIPVATLDLNTKQVDWRQLRRWGIDEARIPADTVVSFREPTIWDRYKGQVLAALALFLTQTVLITALLIQRTRRQQAERRLRGSEAELRTSYGRIRDLGARLLHEQESERSRIARELHDDISQRMALLTMDLEALTVRLEDRHISERLASEASSRAQSIAKSVHDLSHRLHPARLRLMGLVAALQQLRRELSSSGVAIAFTHENVPAKLPPDLTLCAFRIVQEALQNAIKYSQAKDVTVQVSGAPDGLIVDVVDSGVGFDIDASWGKGLGLISMGERLEAIGGSFEIHSRPGAGTRLRATIPLHAVESAGATPASTQPAAPPNTELERYGTV
jgi:signal transduction histidine kinase